MKYIVTLELSRTELLELIDGGALPTIKVVKEAGNGEDVVSPIQTVATTRRRRLRGSKVNDTIKEALNAGPRSAKDLKEALEKADLSPGSLSTGLSLLQKSGDVRRVGEGLYELSAT